MLLPEHVTSWDPTLFVPGTHSLVLLLELGVDEEVPQLRVHSVHDDQVSQAGSVHSIKITYKDINL